MSSMARPCFKKKKKKKEKRKKEERKGRKDRELLGKDVLNR
jgi:hypothetical protein